MIFHSKKVFTRNTWLFIIFLYLSVDVRETSFGRWHVIFVCLQSCKQNVDHW